jgi:hypothetical protein
MNRPECPKEAVQQSSLSPGLVSDDEPIVYILVDPLTVMNGSVKEFSKSQLKRGDLSVCRAKHCTTSEAERAIVQPLLSKPGRSFEGALWMPCQRIRSITLGESRVGAFCVIDDGLQDYRAHAVLAFSTPQDEKLRNEREAARGNLKDLFRENGVQPRLADCPFKSSGSETPADPSGSQPA